MDIRIPANFTPREYQLPLLKAMNKGAKRAVITWHRRGGKDLTCLNYMIGEMAKRVGAYYYLFPTYGQGKRVIWEGIDEDGFKLLDHFPKEFIDGKPNDTELKIKTRNGSLFQVLGAQEIENLRGTNPVGVVFSEFQWHNPTAWQVIRPVLAKNGGWAIFNFTPEGKNHAYDILEEAKSEGWFWQVLTVDDTNIIPKEVLEAEKRNLPQDFFDQEYYCKFIEGASQVFRNFQRRLWSGRMGTVAGHKYTLGVDLAKYNDFTVLSPFDLMTFQAGLQERFNQMDYPLQEAKIEAHYYHYNKPKTRIDSTGVGDPVYDHLAEKGIQNLEPYKITAESRRYLLQNLQFNLEKEKIWIPDDPILISELESFRYRLDGGRVKMEVPSGKHDDTVFALALAVWDIPKDPMTDKVAEKKYIRENYDFYTQQKDYFTGGRYFGRRYSNKRLY